MGTAGYAGMLPIWEKEDEECEKNGKPKPFGHIMCPRTRAWTRARATCDENTGFVPTILNKETLIVVKELVSTHHMLKLMIMHVISSISFGLITSLIYGRSRLMKRGNLAYSREMCSKRGWETQSTLVAQGE